MRATLVFVTAALAGFATASPVAADSSNAQAAENAQVCVAGRGCPPGYVCIADGNLSVLGHCVKIS